MRRARSAGRVDGRPFDRRHAFLDRRVTAGLLGERRPRDHEVELVQAAGLDGGIDDGEVRRGERVERSWEHPDTHDRTVEPGQGLRCGLMYEPDRTIDTGSVTLAVDDRGSGDATPLVLVHGFTGGRIDWADVIDDLATDRRVVAWDHRGHSDSTNTGDPSTYTFDQLVADAVAALDALGLDRFHLLGHSMGGIVAQRLVLEHPERVESLILMDTLAEPALSLPREWIDTTVSTGREQGMGAVADFMARFTVSSSVASEEDRPRIAERNRHKLTNMDVEAFAALAEELRSFPSLLERLGDDHLPHHRARRRAGRRPPRCVRQHRQGDPRRRARRDRGSGSLPAGGATRRVARRGAEAPRLKEPSCEACQRRGPRRPGPR